MSDESVIESKTSGGKRFIFPRWANYALPVLAVAVIGGALYVPVAVGLGFSPKTLAVGYAPVQPVPYSHALHVGQLGLDCRYCHSNVDKSGYANLPTSQTCMNCHNQVKKDSPLLEIVRHSYESGEPVPWVNVHELPDFA